MLVPLRILISKWDSQCDMKKVKYFGGCTWEKHLSGSFFSYITLSWEIEFKEMDITREKELNENFLLPKR